MRVMAHIRPERNRSRDTVREEMQHLQRRAQPEGGASIARRIRDETLRTLALAHDDTHALAQRGVALQVQRLRDSLKQQQEEHDRLLSSANHRQRILEGAQSKLAAAEVRAGLVANDVSRSTGAECKRKLAVLTKALALLTEEERGLVHLEARTTRAVDEAKRRNAMATSGVEDVARQCGEAKAAQDTANASRSSTQAVLDELRRSLAERRSGYAAAMAERRAVVAERRVLLDLCAIPRLPAAKAREAARRLIAAFSHLQTPLGLAPIVTPGDLLGVMRSRHERVRRLGALEDAALRRVGEARQRLQSTKAAAADASPASTGEAVDETEHHARRVAHDLAQANRTVLQAKATLASMVEKLGCHLRSPELLSIADGEAWVAAATDAIGRSIDDLLQQGQAPAEAGLCPAPGDGRGVAVAAGPEPATLPAEVCDPSSAPSRWAGSQAVPPSPQVGAPAEAPPAAGELGLLDDGDAHDGPPADDELRCRPKQVPAGAGPGAPR